MANEDVISSHLTKAAAMGRAFDLNRDAAKQGNSRSHSSGWTRLDYGVRKNPKRLTLKRWRVYVRSR